MVYNLLMSMLSPSAAEETGLKSQPKMPEKAFGTYLKEEKSRAGSFTGRENNDSRSYVEKTKDNKWIKDKEVITEKDDNLKKVIRQSKTHKKDEVEPKDEKEKDKDVHQEKILEKIAQVLGINVQELNNILKANNIEIQKLDDVKINMIVGKLSEMIGDVPQKEQMLEQLKSFFGELKEKAGNNTQVENQEKNVQEAVSVQASSESKEKDGNVSPEKTDNSKQKADLTAAGQDEKKESSAKADKVQTNMDEVKEEKAAKAEEAKNSQENGEENNQDNNGESWKEKVKVVVGNTKDMGLSSKISQENTAQVINNIQNTGDVKEVKTAARVQQNTYVNRDEILKQVIDKASVTLTQDKAEMIVNLKPDNLGKLALKVVTENGIITAQMVAENQQVKQIIETNLNVLKDALEKQGMVVQQFSVSVGHDSWNRGFNQNSQNNNSNSDAGNYEIPGMVTKGYGYRDEEQANTVRMWRPNSTISFTA